MIEFVANSSEDVRVHKMDGVTEIGVLLIFFDIQVDEKREVKRETNICRGIH